MYKFRFTSVYLVKMSETGWFFFACRMNRKFENFVISVPKPNAQVYSTRVPIGALIRRVTTSNLDPGSSPIYLGVSLTSDPTRHNQSLHGGTQGDDHHRRRRIVEDLAKVISCRWSEITQGWTPARRDDVRLVEEAHEGGYQELCFFGARHGSSC